MSRLKPAGVNDAIQERGLAGAHVVGAEAEGAMAESGGCRRADGRGE